MSANQDGIAYVYENVTVFGSGEGWITGTVRYCGDETRRPYDGVAYVYENLV